MKTERIPNLLLSLNEQNMCVLQHTEHKVITVSKVLHANRACLD